MLALCLEKAELVTLLRTKVNGDAFLRKADKLFHPNPNIAYVLGESDADKGNLRESIFLCWTKKSLKCLVQNLLTLKSKIILLK